MMSPTGSAFFWRQWDGSDYEIFLFDGFSFMPESTRRFCRTERSEAVNKFIKHYFIVLDGEPEPVVYLMSQRENGLGPHQTDSHEEMPCSRKWKTDVLA